MKLNLDQSLYLAVEPEGFEVKIAKIKKYPWYHEAKALFLNNMSIQEIASTLSVTETDIKIFALGDDFTGRSQDCWYYERMAVTSAATKKWLKDAIDTKGDVVASIVADGADILQTGLLQIKAAQAGGVILTPKQLKEIAGIIMDMDKISRLESGKATEIIKNVGLTPAEAREIIMNDPFMRKPKDIEIEVVTVKNE